MQEVKEQPKRHNVRTHHVTIRSELKYLIRGKIPGLPWLGFQVETGPKATVPVFRVVRPVATVRFRFQP